MKVIDKSVVTTEINGRTTKQTATYLISDKNGSHWVDCLSYSSRCDFDFAIDHTTMDDIKQLIKSLNDDGIRYMYPDLPSIN